MTAVPLIYRKQTLLELLGISETTLRRWIAEAGFPKPRQLGPRAVGWRASDVVGWIDARPCVSGSEESCDLA